MNIVFEGAEAAVHEVEAYSGVVSLEGIARAATLAAHYAATNQVRFRAPYSNDVEFRFSAPQEGSLDFPLKVVSRLGGTIASQKTKTATALFLALLARSSGQEIEQDIKDEIAEVQSGDLDALAEAATAGMERAHRWIDLGSKSISVKADGVTAITLDKSTREYLETEDIVAVQSQDVTVAAVNANSRTGRVFFDDLKRTVPFKVSRDATGRTLSNLSKYLNRYVDKTNEWVSIKFLPISYPDGRLKRVMILDCALASELD